MGLTLSGLVALLVFGWDWGPLDSVEGADAGDEQNTVANATDREAKPADDNSNLESDTASQRVVWGDPAAPNGTPLVARSSDEPAKANASEAKRAARRHEAIDAACRQYEAGRILESRRELNRILQTDLTREEHARVRRWLTKAADETIFSTRRLPNDPLIGTYTIQSGDALIHIAKKFDVPYEILMRINRIRNARNIRGDQTIKIVNGPFHARIYKSAFRMDVYLQNTFVRSFPVGIGLDDATPEGTWKVKNRLSNPTYYPPPSAEKKRIIAADDPENPLGEHWIGLEGVDGAALGRYGYGIHGTIKPDSIGTPVSLGCVRMHNDDVAFLFGLLKPGKSTVTILP